MSDKQQFSDLLDELGVEHGRDVTPQLKTLLWKRLKEIPIETIKAACMAHQQDPDRGRFFPKSADIFAVVRDNQLDVDEAWSIGFAGRSEEETVCTTSEILQAMDAARPILDAGDEVGARMAFRAVYKRIVGRSVPQWFMSVGSDQERRHVAAQAALDAGRISASLAKTYLPAPKSEGIPAAIAAGLLSGKVSRHPSTSDAVARREIAKMRGLISDDEQAS